MTKTNVPPNQKIGYLEDNQGNPSSIRLMSMIALFASIGFGLITILHSAAGQNENGL